MGRVGKYILVQNIKDIITNHDADGSLYSSSQPSDLSAEYTEVKLAYDNLKTLYDAATVAEAESKFHQKLFETSAYYRNKGGDWYYYPGYTDYDIYSHNPIAIYTHIINGTKYYDWFLKKAESKVRSKRRAFKNSTFWNDWSRGLALNAAKGDRDDAKDDYNKMKHLHDRFTDLIDEVIGSFNYNQINNFYNTYQSANNAYLDKLETKKNNFLEKKTNVLDKVSTYGDYMDNKGTIQNDINALTVPPLMHNALSLNASYIDTLYNNINTLDAIDASFNSYWLNNCTSDKSAIDESGWETCGLNTIYSTYQSSSIQNKKISNDMIVTLTEEQLQSDRFKDAKEVNDKINTKYSYNYLSDPITVGEYTILNKNRGQIIQNISANTQFIENSYNKCDDKHNSLNSRNSDNKPYCLVNEYNDADATCKTAISKSEIFNYTDGTTKLNDYWSSVYNSIPGNTIANNATTLVGATSTCNTWIQMFNKWENLEEEAIANPCSSERPIQSENDPVILKITEEWSKSASSYIEKLMRRLEIIQTYIQKYPNILELESRDVQFGPSSIGASMILRMDKNQTMGVAPVQYLEMLVPNGDKGETGIPGEKGIPGDSGLTGTRGKVGKTGNPTISSRLV